MDFNWHCVKFTQCSIVNMKRSLLDAVNIFSDCPVFSNKNWIFFCLSSKQLFRVRIYEHKDTFFIIIYFFKNVYAYDTWITPAIIMDFWKTKISSPEVNGCFVGWTLWYYILLKSPNSALRRFHLQNFQVFPNQGLATLFMPPP